uniref:Uncharacterized protein n=1 Tax=Arundo donax TaxID=35708 RepID=A0A0A8YN66_ARUDO
MFYNYIHVPCDYMQYTLFCLHSCILQDHNDIFRFKLVPSLMTSPVNKAVKEHAQVQNGNEQAT